MASVAYTQRLLCSYAGVLMCRTLRQLSVCYVTRLAEREARFPPELAKPDPSLGNLAEPADHQFLAPAAMRSDGAKLSPADETDDCAQAPSRQVVRNRKADGHD